MKSQDKIKALYDEIKKRDKIIEKLKEENLILLKTSLKRAEELQKMKKALEKAIKEIKK